MNKFTLRKLILSLLVSFSINNLNCMQASDIEPDSDLVAQSDSAQSKINRKDYVGEVLERIIDTNNNIYEATEEFNVLVDQTGDEEFRKSLTNKFAELIIKKIVQDKLAEYKDTDPVRLLFNKGVTVCDIKLEEEKPCHLATLPNELIYLILIHGIDGCIDSIEPIVLEDKAHERSGFINRFLPFLGQTQQENSIEAIQKKQHDALNAQLSIATSKAISFITNIMQVNKCFYLFSDELIYRLKNRVSQEFLHEKIIEMYQLRELNLVHFLLRGKKIDVNYTLKRFGNPRLSFLTLSVGLDKKATNITLRSIIKMLIDQGAPIRVPASNFSILILAYDSAGEQAQNSESDNSEDLLVFLVQNVPSLAFDKDALQWALAHDMQKLIHVMKENGAIITPEDIEESEKLAKEIESCNQAEPSLFSTCLVC